MAKRRRLDPMATDPSLRSPQPGQGPVSRPPIAEVAGEAARAASFDAVARELAAAREDGRLVLALPLDSIDAGYLVRDRMVLDDVEMESLKDSLRARGQQTPIEVVDRGVKDYRKQYGLISGLRRLCALRALTREDPERFGTVLALVRRPEGAADAYLAMVEENEVRAGLSFYERAHLAVAAAEAGIYPDTETALRTLYAAAPKPKRSKIRSFVTLVEALRGNLCFPADIPEHLGLKLVKALREEPSFGPVLSSRLVARPPETPAEERARLEAALKGRAPAPDAPALDREVAPGIRVQSQRGEGSLRITGTGVTADLIVALENWIAERSNQRPKD